jgi:error-prone DNA polymerase
MRLLKIKSARPLKEFHGLTSFAELSVRSSFSGLGISGHQDGPTCAHAMRGWPGAERPEKVVDRAELLGLDAISITDVDTISGVVRAHRHSKGLRVRCIIGTELLLSEGSLLLHVMNSHGYANLCTILTKAKEGLEKGQIHHRLETVCSHAAGLYATIAPPFQFKVSMLKEAFGSRLSIAVFYHQTPEDTQRLKWANQIAHHFDVPMLATARACLADTADKSFHDVMTCVHQRMTLREAGQRLMPNAAAVLRGPKEMAELFRDDPETLTRSKDVADACAFSLDDLQYTFPSDDEERESPQEKLERITWEKAVLRYGVSSAAGLPADVIAQLRHELALIQTIGVAAYFLTTYEIVELARERRILYQGRGSAANSAVCYCLGITAIDPVQMGLLFERFMSAERGEPPDIDVDFEHERREEVIQAIYEKFGRDHAGMVCNVTSFRGRSAIREVGKVLELSETVCSKLASFVGRRGNKENYEESCQALGLDVDDALLQRTWCFAERLIGHPRHLSIHVGGFILTKDPIVSVAPIEPARKEDRTIIPFDKDDVSDLGLFKMDVLGLGMLTCIRKSFEMLQNHYGVSHALHTIPKEDPKVYDALCRADTIGVFQVESRAQMSMLPRLKPRTFYDLVVQVAIIRPGPIQGGMVHPYLQRRSGCELVTYPNEDLEPILKKTLGVPIFQEQVMRVAMIGAGYSPGEADQLRRDMAAWKKGGRLHHHKEKLILGFKKNGIEAEWAERLYSQVEGFGEYGFPESHAASFAILVYVSAWIKVYYPDVFAASLLNSQPMGFYTPSQIVADAQEHGVQVNPVSVNHSDWDSCLRWNSKTKENEIRLGLRLVKNLPKEESLKILSQRQDDGPYENLNDVFHRNHVSMTAQKALAYSGALDELSSHRRDAILRSLRQELPLLQGRLSSQKKTQLSPPKDYEILQMDFTHVGLSLDDHPMCHLRFGARELLRQQHPGAELLQVTQVKKAAAGRQVFCAGMVTLRQRPGTAGGTCFITLEDETGMLNVIVWKRYFEKWRYEIISKPFLLVRGVLEKKETVVHVIANAVYPLRYQAAVPSDRSRDFC